VHTSLDYEGVRVIVRTDDYTRFSKNGDKTGGGGLSKRDSRSWHVTGPPLTPALCPSYSMYEHRYNTLFVKRTLHHMRALNKLNVHIHVYVNTVLNETLIFIFHMSLYNMFRSHSAIIRDVHSC
jgi:hypothetical protein